MLEPSSLFGVSETEDSEITSLLEVSETGADELTSLFGDSETEVSETGLLTGFGSVLLEKLLRQPQQSSPYCQSYY